MRRKEIDKKFDEIVAFANLEKFLDTPVKHYSSGMYVRLGFAVAAHLENEILLVDEVLAVGDIEFQRKCLGKMHEVARVGRTVLFISHNMPAIVSLCGRCLLMDSGVILSSGLASDVVSGYYKGGKFLSSSVIFSKKPPVGDDLAVLLEGHVALSNGDHASEVDINQPCQIEMKFEILKEANVSFIPSFHFYTSEGTSAFVASMPTAKRLKAGRHTAICKIPPNFLNDKVYFVGLALTALGNGLKANFFENNALSFIVKDPIEGTRGRNGYAGPIPGEVRPQFEWMIEPSGQAQ
ncbi:MAG: hypothetical protein AUJ72_05850 [Candidatus Omnitrophica bacterium CG1_02_46_14]|nr:MAG: hypothetical protein AUJ72_05850 [Candidatus Omnitrophica bacterium CG1_02_46_14]